MKRASLLLLLAACQGESSPSPPSSAPTSDQFGGDTRIRIDSPVAGETVGEQIDVHFIAGADVVWVGLGVDDTPLTWVSPSAGMAQLTAPEGRHTLLAIAADADYLELQRHTVDIRVVLPEVPSWVTITSPAEGATLQNPVQLVAEGSPSVATIELLAGAVLLGEITPGGVLTRDLPAETQELHARAYDTAGELLALDTVTVTVLPAPVDPGPSEVNQLVLAAITGYPTDGTISYYWPQGTTWPGNTRDLFYQGVQVASSGGFGACYCVGLTWETFFGTWQAHDQAQGGSGDDLGGLTPAEVLSMRTTWFVRDDLGDGPGLALEAAGLGVALASFDDWRAGDFVQLWRRNGSGHQVVFLEWLYDDEQNRIGFEYFACNGDGPSFNDEYFGSHSSALDPEHLYAGRPFLP